ncbi:ITG-like peptide [Nilaparvata lugens]|uniref:ITG-like peptide n=1 Tax=Nilaparvata lugens TaxID=108931 RepID=UPI00193E6A34|nr:ITG-like peptide [Nilaparvata lugens]
MKTICAVVMVGIGIGCLLVQPSDAWGGLFQRLTPEMLSGGYGGSSFRAQPFLQNPGELDSFQELQEAELEGQVPCYGRRCSANEYCCEGSICIDVDGRKQQSHETSLMKSVPISGTCLPLYGLRQGELCRRDNDCETGLVCTDTGEGRTCQPAITSRKLYNEECSMSSECDIHKGLCCQFQRRHRQAPRKVCSYFKDPLVCIGPVASDQIKMADLERTAGEKRLTAKSSFSHLKR